LSHLNALRAFEATARLGSYVRAADELAVTAAAVGQQVRTLEDYLGGALFERHGKRLVLTDAARAVMPDIKDAFDRLAQASSRLLEQRREPFLNVTVAPSFAAKWLIPRIGSFRSAHPDIDVRLDTTTRLADLARESIALGIRYGVGGYPGLDGTLLMREEVFPVCSPAFLSGDAPLATVHDLANTTLIHDTSMESRDDFPSWATWLRATGAPGVDARRGLRVNSSVLALQAAVEGQGVALARSVIAAGDLAAGRLVRVLPQACSTKHAYYLVYPAKVPLSQAASAFCGWLKQAVAEFQDAIREPDGAAARLLCA
jgi:LysR family glycine cleavage system transcriptional activator